MEENIIVIKSYDFAKKIVLLYKELIQEKEFVLSRQLLKSGTSIGANVEEAQGGQSKKDFITKIQISLKEARETHFWLRLMRDTDFIEKTRANELIKLCDELITIMTAILKKAKGNLK